MKTGDQLWLRFTLMSCVMRQWKQSSSCKQLTRLHKENLPYDHVCLFTVISCCKCQHVIYVVLLYNFIVYNTLFINIFLFEYEVDLNPSSQT